MLPKPTFCGKLSGSDLAFFRVKVCVRACMCAHTSVRACLSECPMHHCTLRDYELAGRSVIAAV